MTMRWPALALTLCLASGIGQAWAEDPPDMLALARSRADRAPDALSARALGQVALPTYESAKFRNVRGYYIRQELTSDQIVFCGELDAIVSKTGKRSGWTKFMYLPGDPTTLMTDTPGLGSPEIGPEVRKHWCDIGEHNWLAADFTSAFQRMPKSLAEARNSQ